MRCVVTSTLELMGMFLTVRLLFSVLIKRSRKKRNRQWKKYPIPVGVESRLSIIIGDEILIVND